MRVGNNAGPFCICTKELTLLNLPFYIKYPSWIFIFAIIYLG